MEGMGPIVKWLKRFEDISSEFSNPDLDPDKMDKLLSEQADLQEKIEHADGWEIDRKLDVAMDALRLPPGDEGVKHLSGGKSVASRSAVSPAKTRIFYCSTSLPIISTPKASRGSSNF